MESFDDRTIARQKLRELQLELAQIREQQRKTAEQSYFPWAAQRETAEQSYEEGLLHEEGQQQQRDVYPNAQPLQDPECEELAGLFQHMASVHAVADNGGGARLDRHPAGHQPEHDVHLQPGEPPPA